MENPKALLAEQRECHWYSVFGERMPGSNPDIQIPEDLGEAQDRVREIQAMFEEQFPDMVNLQSYWASDCEKEIIKLLGQPR
jgi:hypothetical protein